MSKTKTTISDIAKHLNISPSTVSRALNDNELISQSTRDKVWEAARQLNYKPNLSAQSLKGIKTALLGILVPDLSTSFYRDLVNSTQVYANARGYQTIIAQSHSQVEEEKKAVELFEKLGVEGIIVHIGKETENYDHFELLSGILPVVFVGRRVPLTQFSSVLSNECQGTYDAARQLLDYGRKRIAFYGGPIGLSEHLEQVRGFKNAMKDMQIEPDDNWIGQGVLDAQSAYNFMEKIFSHPPYPDAIISGSAFASLGILRYLEAYGLKCPKDVAIITMDDSKFGKELVPSLSVVNRRGDAIGSLACELLVEALQSPKQYIPTFRIIRPEIILRQSSKTANAKPDSWWKTSPQ